MADVLRGNGVRRFRGTSAARRAGHPSGIGSAIETVRWTLTATLPLAAGMSWAQIAERSPVTAPTTY
ncbi:hypothetical protein [Rhodococcus sp. JVH1]|uniref:hypothetical protein n=1 Tax=Rhodococcus sp. JVH1 TaxID=745408 RepID=UPI0002721C1A|nr:hypothetical protein [Rhodococcus sp. JVH1]EJJ01297.1 hypothetical protein JVH1_1177 [Rhodococcus sp. JVH1]